MSASSPDPASAWSLDELSAMVWICGVDAHCTYFNAAWLRFTGRSLVSQLDEGWLADIFDSDREACLATLRRSLANGAAFSLEFRLRRHDGEFRWVQGLGQPHSDDDGKPSGCLVTCFDIHERRLDEDAFREMRGALESSMTGISKLDRDGVFVEVRRVYAGMLGYEADEMIGLAWSDVVPEADHPLAVQAVQKAVETGRAEVELRGLRKDGSTFVKQLLLVRRSGARGEHIGYYCFIRDVTERHWLQEQLRHAERVQAVGQLTSGIAHNFNNMLQAVMGNLELALSESGSNLRACLEDAMAASERAMDVVRQLLIYTRHEDELPPQDLDVRTLALEAVKICSGTFDSRIDVQLALHETPPIAGDASQLQQVFVNLMLNARDAVTDISDRLPRIRVESTYDPAPLDPAPLGGSEGGWIRVSVEDNGSGMSEPVRDRIFEPFFTTKEVGSGTGLGPSTVQTIVEQCGGRIECRSEPGSGSIFTVHLPVAESATAVRAPDASPGTPASPSECRILLVEDQDLVRETVADLLTSANYTVVAARDGEAAIERFDDAKGEFDAVLLDLSMPRMSGRDVLAQIRIRDAQIPLIVLSGLAIEADDLPPATAILQKPARSAEILATLQELLSRRLEEQP